MCGFPQDVFSSVSPSNYERKDGVKILCTLKSKEQPQVTLSSAWDASYLYVNFDDKKFWTFSAGRWKGQLEQIQSHTSDKDKVVKVLEMGKDMMFRTVENRTFLRKNSNGQISPSDLEFSACIKSACLVGDKSCLLFDDGSLCLSPANSPLPGNRLSLGWRVQDVACGSDHVLLLEEGTGRVWSMGLNLRGQLGHGDLTKRLEPCVVEALDGMKMTAILCGQWHNLVLSEFGDLYSWGWNAHRQLGHSHDVATVALPHLIEMGDLEFTSVGCGSRHSAALTNCGKLLTWGWNGYGQLGHGNNDGPAELCLPMGRTVSWMGCGPWNTFLMSNEIEKE